MIKAFGLTDTGRQRENNEDTLFFNEATNLYLVADGMGGHRSGELASAKAASLIKDFIVRTHRLTEITWPYGYQTDASFNANRLVTALKLANRVIWKQADADPDHYGMGTTVVCLLIEKQIATFVSAGDSRLYLFRNRSFQQLTTDDSWIAAAAHNNDLSTALRHVLTKAVGVEEELEVSAKEIVLQPNDYLLLSTDGLHSVVPEEEIVSIVHAEGTTPEEKARCLVGRANQLGGPDNITVLLLEVE